MKPPRWSVARQLVEPARFWIRFVPRAWPGAAQLWTDVSSARLGDPGPPDLLPSLPEGKDLELGDLVYLPPVRQEAAAWRDRLAMRFVEHQTPVLLQLLPEQSPPQVPPSPLIHYLHDGLAKLLRGEVAGAVPYQAGATVLWPLVGGLTDDAGFWRRACEALTRAGVAVVQSMALELSPAHRRRLVESCEDDAAHAVFHRPNPPERSFDVVAQSLGLQSFLPRLTPGLEGRDLANRHLAGLLGLAGELWHRMGRDISRGEELFRASRWVESTAHDVLALAREGNLGLVREVGGAGRQVIDEWAAAGASAFFEEVRESYRSEEMPVEEVKE